MFNFKTFFKSAGLAFRGLKVALYEEQSFRIQLVAAVMVIALMVALPLQTIERILLLFAILMVLGLELTNSIVERLLDLIEIEYHPKIRDAKDIMAGAVLIVVSGAALVGVLILLPHIINQFRP